MNSNHFTTKRLFRYRENKDRFISLSAIDYELAKRGLREEEQSVTPVAKSYNEKLKEIFIKEDREARLQQHLVEATGTSYEMGLLGEYDGAARCYETMRAFRKIDEKAYKVLDAPGYSKGSEYHSIDANSKGLLAALINNQVFLNSTLTGKTQKLVSNLNNISALKFTSRDDLLVIGTAQGHLAFYDLNKETSIVIKEHHKDTVASIDFTGAHNVISVGRDRRARVFDIRTKTSGRAYDFFNNGLCTVKSSPNNPFAFCTGEAKGRLSIVDTRLDTPLYYRKEHNSDLRALAWHASKRDLVYSAGMAAGELKCTNAASFEQVNEHRLSTGVSALLFSKAYNELLVAQNGGNSCVEVRSAKGLTKLAELRGHSQPVLDICHLNQTDFISGSMDQSLRFWNLASMCPDISKADKTTERRQRLNTGCKGLLLR